MMLSISLVSLSIWLFAFAQEENSTTLEIWTKFREDLWELAWGFGNITKIIKSTEPLDCSDGCKVISAEWEVKVVRAKYNESNKTIYYYTEAEKIYFNPQSAEMFSQFTWLTQLDMTGFDTSKVTDMSNMFKWCSKIKKLDLKKRDTSNVTDMSSMFHGCSGLTWLDVSKFNTSKVTNMSSMFNWCNNSKFTTLDVSKFNTSNVTNMSSMFNWCSKLTGLDLSKFDTSKVTSMEKMFNNCKWLKNLNLNNFNTNNVTTMQSMFNWCSNIIELDLSNFVTNKLININSMFNNCWSLKELNLSWWNTNNVTDMNQLFNGCSNLEELDLTTFNTSNVTRMDWMFWWDSLLTTIYASELFSLSDITTSSNMFKDATNIIWWSGTTYNEENVDWTYAVIDQWEEHPWYFSIKNKESIFLPWEKFNGKIKSLANLTGMTFNNTDSKIISITRSYEKPQIDNLEILSIIWAKNPIYAWYDNGTIFYYTESEKVYMNPNSKSMFQWLSKLENIDLRDVYTNNVTDMSNMFNWCESLENLNIENFDTSNVVDMRYMFNNCNWLKNLNLSNFDTSKVTTMERMFNWCESLETLDVTSFNTSNVTNMNYIFNNCKSLKILDLKSFDTSNTERMRNAFSNCESLEILNLESFNTSGVTNVNQMFNNATNLKTIYVSNKFVTTSFTWTTIMFLGDVNLVWWNGTVYDSSQVDLGYARIDGKDGLPWYFTDANNITVRYIDENGDVLYTTWVVRWNVVTGLTPDEIVERETGHSLKYYADEERNTIFDFTSPITKYTEIYTKWELNQYTIRFIKLEWEEYYIFTWYFWSEVTPPSTDPTREWYTFRWWDKEIPKTVPAENITITAQREEEKQSWGWYSWWWGHSHNNSVQESVWKEGKENKNQDSIPTDDQKNETETQAENIHEWSYNNWLTKYINVSDARLGDSLTRSEMAKISSIFATKVLWKTPDESKQSFCSKFVDLQELDVEMRDYVIKVCELWYMWYQSNGVEWLVNFRPYSPVTVAEASVIVSRMLRWNQNASNKESRYNWHLHAVYNYWLIDDIRNPYRNIIRWETFEMFYRISHKK